MERAVTDFLFESESEELSSSDLFTFIDDSSSSSTCSENIAQNVNFLEIIHSFSNADFKKHFRLHRSTVQILIDRYKLLPHFQFVRKRGLPKTSPEKEIHLFLWYMTNTNSFREISNLFEISGSTAWNIVKRVSSWLISTGHEYIKWPNTNEVAQNAALMETKSKITGVLGCIDVTHVEIKAPIHNKDSYLNRQRYYSISLQAVVDANKKFINIFCGEPGSLHDSRVLRRSDLYRDGCDGTDRLFPNNTFLLGDSAYPRLEWLITPFKENGTLTDAQRIFNNMHSSGRVIVRHSFASLKTRFQRLLHFTDQTNINFVVNLSVCACILHNMCIDNNDELEEKYISEAYPEID